MTVRYQSRNGESPKRNGLRHTRATLARARAHAEMQVAAMHAGPAQGIRWEDFYAYQHYAQAGAARVARGW